MHKGRGLVLVRGCVLLTLCGCSRREPSAASDTEKTVLHFFSNNPDRANGQGRMEQTIIDHYVRDNPDVSILVETLDEEAYKTKFKAYSISGLPDVFAIWGQPSFLNDMLAAHALAGLDEETYADYGFIEGSLNGFRGEDGKLYGLPCSTDVMTLYYNQKLFAEHGWQLPQTYEELLTLAERIRKVGLVPIAMDGLDGYPLCIYWMDLMVRLGANASEAVETAIEQADFSNPIFALSLDWLVRTSKAGVFQTGYQTQDYGAAMNLFISGRAAMFYMGSWDASISVNGKYDPEITSNIRAFMLPPFQSNAEHKNDLMAWNGGGYAVAADSDVREAAIRFLNYMMRPENLSALMWRFNVGMSAQEANFALDEAEHPLQSSFYRALSQASSQAGTPINDRGSSFFKAIIEKNIAAASDGSLAAERFLALLEAECRNK